MKLLVGCRFWVVSPFARWLLSRPPGSRRRRCLDGCNPHRAPPAAKWICQQRSECVKDRTDPQRHHVHVVELGKDGQGFHQSVLIQPEMHPIIYTAHHSFELCERDHTSLAS